MIGMSARRAPCRRGELMTRSSRKVGSTGTPPSWRADTTRSPESGRGVHTVGTASGWRPATGKSAVRAHWRGGERMASGYWKISGASPPLARRADGAGNPDSRRGEYASGAVSGRHTATRRANGRYSERMSRGNSDSRRVTRRPENRWGKDSTGVGCRWHTTS
jgi:hypothetical protein